MEKVTSIQRIHDLDDDVIQHHIDRALKLKNISGKKIGTYNYAEVWQTGDLKENYLILFYKGEVLYLVKSRVAKLGAERFGQQVMAIRNYNAVHKSPATGFLLWAFLKKLLPQYGVLVSDEQQTVYGESAFRYIIKAVLGKKKYVYVYNRRTSPTQWLRINRMKDLFNNEDWIYGASEGHRRVYIIISEQPLKPKSKAVVFLN